MRSIPGIYRDANHPATPEEDASLRLSDLAKLARRRRRRIVAAAREEDQPTFPKLLSAHLGRNIETLEVVSETWPGYDHVNVQVGLDAWFSEPGRSHELVGLTNLRHRDFGLTDLLRQDPTEPWLPRPGNVSWANLASGPEGQVRRCVSAGLYFVSVGDVRLAAMMRAPDPERGMSRTHLEIISDDHEAARAMAAQVRQLALRHNVFRGQVVSFGTDVFGERESVFRFHTRPSMDPGDLVLPAETVAMIERQVVGVARHRIGCSRPGSTSSAGSCSTVRPGWARHTPSGTWSASSPGSPSSS